jgi:hypothetical protein
MSLSPKESKSNKKTLIDLKSIKDYLLLVIG